MSDISIAEAKNRLPALLREVESGEALRITRRGRIVAVVLGLKEYESLVAAAKARPSLKEAISRYRESACFGWELSPEEVDEWRDPSEGRRVL